MKTLKKIVAILAVALMLCSILPLSAFAADGSATFDSSAVNNTNQKEMPTWTDPNGIVTITPDKGGNSNGIKYYTNGSAYRMYPKNTVTITVADGYVIDTVVITTTSSNGMTETKTKPIENATWSISGTTITLTATSGATSVKFGHDPSLSSGNIRFAKIVVNYSQAGGCIHVYDDCNDASCNNCSEERTAPGHKWDSCEATECLNCDATREALSHTYTSIYATRCATCGGGVRDAATLPADTTALTILEANDVAMLGGSSYTTNKYCVTGVVESIDNTSFGNLYIQDAEGNKLYVYGVYGPNGEGRYDALGDLQPQIGDEITLYGQLGTYSGSAQMKNGWLVIAGACTHENAVYDNNCESTICPDCKLELPALEEHSFAADIIPATCTKTGTATYECDVCGYSYEEELPLAAHNYVDGECSVCGAVKPTITKIDSVANLTAGVYKMAGYLTEYNNSGSLIDWSANPWHVWTGAVNSGDLVTTPYAYDESTGDFAIGNTDTTDEGIDIELIAVDGKENTYYISVNGQYLYSTKEATNRSLALGETPAEWVAADNANGGINLSSNGVYLGTAAAASKMIRSYKSESTLKYGVVFFAFETKPACEHEYDSACDVDCNLCGETREVTHNVIAVEAKAATCSAEGNLAYWYCDVCGMAWLDAECTLNTNLKAVVLPATGEHTYFDDCSAICEVCGYEREASHNVIAVEAKAATCSAEGNLAYWYCDACGMAWLDAECTLNTNLKAVKLPATGEHTYDDEYDADCNVCGDIREVPEKPVEIVYGDADGDGEITALDLVLLQQFTSGWEVELDEVAGDADGDGEITAMDLVLLQQYTSGWDVVLGPEDSEESGSQFNDGTLEEW